MRRFVVGDKEVLVDKKDFYLLENHQWYLKDDKYLKTKIGSKFKYLHQLILPSSKMVDHIDRNPLNNKRANLRIVDKSRNAMNSKVREDNTSGIKGISYRKDRGTWHAYITKDRKRVNIGNFHNLKDAIKARLRYEKILFGKYANKELLAKMKRIVNE